MWELLPPKFQAIIAVTAGAFALVLIQLSYALITGQATSPLHWTSLAVSVVTVGFVFVGNAIWFAAARLFPALQTVLFPDLNGTWTGQLRSTWTNPETGEGAPPINVSVTIRQALFTMSIRLVTQESSSRSVRVFLEADRENKRYRVHHFYANDPKAKSRDRLVPHDGMAYLECDWEQDRDRLTGQYFTDRKTTGDIELRRIGGLAKPPTA